MPSCGRLFARAAAVLGFAFSAVTSPTAFAQSATQPDADVTSGGPIRLRQPQQAPNPAPPQSRLGTGNNTADKTDNTDSEVRPSATPRYKPGEFEAYVQSVSGDQSLRRFGSELVIDTASNTVSPQDSIPPVPPDYRVAPGDELLVSIWGAVDADLRLTIDRTGRISIPRIGSVVVNGLTLPEAGAAIDRQARRIFKNFELNVTLGQLRNIRGLHGEQLVDAVSSDFRALRGAFGFRQLPRHRVAPRRPHTGQAGPVRPDDLRPPRRRPAGAGR